MTSNLHPRLQDHLAAARRNDGSIDLDALLAAVNVDYARHALHSSAQSANAVDSGVGDPGPAMRGGNFTQTYTADNAMILRAFDDARTAISIYDANEHLVLCNDYTRRFLYHFDPAFPRPGVTFSELCEAYARHHLAGQGEDAIQRRVNERLKDFRNPTGVMERPLADGRWVLSTERPTKDGGTITINVDITDRKRVEEALRESEVRLRAITENAPMGIGLSTLADRRVIYANPTMARLFGYDRKDLIGQSTNILYMNAESATLTRKSIEQNPNGLSADVEFRRRDGTPFWGHASLSIVNYGGEPCVIGAFYDNTAAHDSQRLLAESEARTRGILANVPDAVLTLDVNGSILSFNPAAERLFGYSADEVRGLSFTLLMPEDMRIIQAENIRRYRQEGEARYVGQGPRRVIAQQKNGTVLALEISIGALSDSSGTTLVAIARDVSDRERAEAELRAAKQRADFANRAKSAFIANISHELRTPLNAILGFSDIIRKQLLGAGVVDRYAEYAADIHASGSHLLAIINDILDLSKIEAGMSELDEDEIDIAPAVAASLRLVAERAAQGGVTVIDDVPARMPRIRADQRKLKQVLINLVSNAVKFTPAGGSVRIEAARSSDGIAFVVADSGIGMAPDDIPVALTPFTQLDGTLARKYEGTGLGLPLAKALVEMHGGSFLIESEIGKGTTVRFHIPESRVVPDP